MEKLVVSPAPHIHSGASARRVMLDVVLALLPVTVASVILFGAPALAVLLACVLGAVLSEALFNLALHRPQTIGDLSAVVTGLLLGLNLSTNVPLWQCVVGAAFAIIVVKCLFGGLGRNFANPAITGRVFMLIAFASVAGGSMPTVVELTATATPLEQLASAGVSGAPGLWEMFIGLHGGAIGETCILALLLGYAYLVFRRVIKWYVPAAFIATVFVCYWVASADAMLALYEILAGGLFIGAIFMATDYVTTPITSRGRVVFALGCGVITFIIRYFCRYPEGVSFSILIMNILTPFIDRVTGNEPLGGSANRPKKGSFAKPALALVALVAVAAGALTGLNVLTAPVIEKNAAGQQTELLYAVLPDAEGFDLLYDANAADASAMTDVPETVRYVYSETSGMGYAMLLSTTKGYTGEPMDITLAISGDGKIIDAELTAYPETKDFGVDSYPGTYVGQDSTLSGVSLVAGVTYSSVAFRDAVSDAFSALTGNGLVTEAVKSDDQILEELLPQVYPGFANASGIPQFEEQEVAEGQFSYIQRILKGMNESGFAYFTRDGENNYLAFCNLAGGCRIYNTAGEELSGDAAYAAMVEEVRTHALENMKQPKKPAKKLRKLVSDEAVFTAISLENVFNSVTEAYAIQDGETSLYGFIAKPYGYNNLPMEIFIVLDESGAIHGMNVDELIFFGEYFTDYTLDEDAYKAGFKGLTAESWTGEQALIAGATFSSEGVRVGTTDVLNSFAAIRENGGNTNEG